MDKLKDKCVILFMFACGLFQNISKNLASFVENRLRTATISSEPLKAKCDASEK